MYSNEAAFSKAFTTKLIKAGYSVTRIESHSTGNGIPDMFVQGHDDDFWIELKNSTKSKNTECVTVPWRPGQQAWSLEYYRLHNKRKQVATLMSTQEGIFIIPMRNNFPRNMVTKPWFLTYEEFKLDVKKPVDLIRLLTFATHNRNYSSCVTFRDAVLFWVDYYYPDDYDYDPEVIWPLSNISIDAPCEPGIMNKIQFDLWRNLG